MAFFSSGSRALVEILTRLQSAERPMPVDHTLFEFGSIRYHLQASITDSENIYLSISTPSLSYEASPSSGLPEITLQETRKMYHKFAEIIEPAKEGYTLTLRLNFSGLTRSKDRTKAINQISLLQSVILSSQLKNLLGSLGSSGTMKLVYNQRDPFFVSKTGRHGPGHRVVVLPGAAGPREHVVLLQGAAVQLVADPATRAARGVRAPPHHQRWLRVLRHPGAARQGEEGGQDCVDPAQLPVLREIPHQVHPKLHSEQDEKASGDHDRGTLRPFEETLLGVQGVAIALNQACSESVLFAVLQVIDDAKFRGNDESRKKLQVRKRSKRRSIKFARAKKLEKGFKAVIDKIKRLRLRIRVKGLDRFRRHCQCFPVPKLTMAQRKEHKYQKLE